VSDAPVTMVNSAATVAATACFDKDERLFQVVLPAE